MKITNYIYIFICVGMLPFALISEATNAFLDFVMIIVVPYVYYFLLWKPLLDFEYRIKEKHILCNDYKKLLKYSYPAICISIILCLVYFAIANNFIIFILPIPLVFIWVFIIIKKSIFYYFKRSINETTN